MAYDQKGVPGIGGVLVLVLSSIVIGRIRDIKRVFSCLLGQHYFVEVKSLNVSFLIANLFYEHNSTEHIEGKYLEPSWPALG